MPTPLHIESSTATPVPNVSIQRQSLRKRVINGSIWSLGGTLLAQGFTFAATLVCSRLLGKTGFGQLGMVRDTVGMFGVFAGMGLGLTATRFVAEYRSSDPERTARILRLCAITALVSGLVVSMSLFAAAPYVSSHYLSAPDLARPLAIGCILLFLYAYDGAQKGALAGFEAYHVIARINALVGIITLPVVGFGVWREGLTGALFALVFCAALTLACNNVALRHQCELNGIPRSISGVFKEARVLVDFSMPAVFSSAMIAPVTWACNAMLVHQPQGYAEMGLMTAANQMRQLAMLIPVAALQCLLPILASELNNGGNSRTADRLHIINAYASFFATTSIVAIMLFLIGPLLHLYGKDFANGRAAMAIVLCSLPVLTYKDGIGRLIQARSLLWYGAASNLFWALILLAGAFILTSRGAAGLALAYLIAYVVNSIIFVPIYYRRLHMGRSIRRDLHITVILSLALLPGIMHVFFHFPMIVDLITLLFALAMISAAFIQLRRWFNQEAA